MRSIFLLVIVILLPGCSYAIAMMGDEPPDVRSFSEARLEFGDPVEIGTTDKGLEFEEYLTRKKYKDKFGAISIAQTYVYSLGTLSVLEPIFFAQRVTKYLKTKGVGDRVRLTVDGDGLTVYGGSFQTPYLPIVLDENIKDADDVDDGH